MFDITPPVFPITSMDHGYFVVSVQNQFTVLPCAALILCVRCITLTPPNAMRNTMVNALFQHRVTLPQRRLCSSKKKCWRKKS